MWSLTIVQRPEAVPLAPNDLAGVRVWRDNDDTVIAYSQAADGYNWLLFPGFACYSFQQDTNQIIATVSEDTGLNLVWDTYYRSVLPLALQVQGLEVLHASAVQMKDGIVGFCGTSESGKSTLSYAFGQRGYPIWCDDGLAFEIGEDQVLALPLPFRTRLRPASVAHFGVGESISDVLLDDESSERMQQPAQPIAALCILKQSAVGINTPVAELVRLSPADAFMSVLPHAYAFSLDDTDRKQRMIQQYFDFTSRIPVVSVRYQRGLNHLDQVLDLIESEFGLLKPAQA